MQRNDEREMRKMKIREEEGRHKGQWNGQEEKKNVIIESRWRKLKDNLEDGKEDRLWEEREDGKRR